MKKQKKNKNCDCLLKNEIQESQRRDFLSKICLYLGSFASFMVSIPIFSSFFSPWLKIEKPMWRDVGKESDFEIGTTVLVKFENSKPLKWGKTISQTASWLQRKNKHEFVAFSINCAHLGCPVRWEKSSELFLCPCHGGVYYKDGTVAAGPPPKPLPQYPVRINEGLVQIKTQAIPITTLTS